MPNPSISIQPFNDFNFSLTPNQQTGEIVIDLMLAPSGDLALVNSINRLVQMVVFWLLTPQGQNVFDPSYGNPYYLQLGRPTSTTTQQDFLDMLDACEQAFLHSQEQAAAAGQLSADEMVDHFADNQVTITNPGQITVSFTIVARSGTTKSLAIPFASTLAQAQL